MIDALQPHRVDVATRDKSMDLCKFSQSQSCFFKLQLVIASRFVLTKFCNETPMFNKFSSVQTFL